MNWIPKNPSSEFEQEITKELDTPLTKCRQCGICAAVCPVNQWAKTSPDTLVALIRADEQERAVRADINWLCMSCDNCTDSCPEKISIKDIANTLKQISFVHGYADEAVGAVEMIPLAYETIQGNISGKGK